MALRGDTPIRGMGHHLGRIISGLALLVAALPVPAFAATFYSVTVLSAPGGGVGTVNSISSSGAIISGNGMVNGISRPIVWNASGVPTLLPVDNIYVNTPVIGTSANGQYILGSDGLSFYWNGGVQAAIPGLHPAADDPYAVNDFGQVAGLHDYGQGGRRWNADGSHEDLGTLGGSDIKVAAINNNGDVAGDDSTGPGFSSPRHAFVWSEGVMTDLGTLGGANSWLYGLSSRYAGGASQIGSGGGVDIHGYVYNLITGEMIDVGAPTDFSAVRDVNDIGWAVGSFHQAGVGGTPEHAFLWGNGNFFDLNTLIDPTLGITLVSASSLNNLGHIVGRGTLNGETISFLLRPAAAGGTGSPYPPASLAVPEPGSWAMMIGGFGLVGAGLRRRSSKKVAVRN